MGECQVTARLSQSISRWNGSIAAAMRTTHALMFLALLSLDFLSERRVTTPRRFRRAHHRRRQRRSGPP